MGLLTGTVLGAGLGMLFAPRAGSELRNQLSEQAGNFANTASEGYRRASEAATRHHVAVHEPQPGRHPGRARARRARRPGWLRSARSQRSS